MSTITTRAGKGSVLTYTEVDTNFTNLNTDKIQATNSPGTNGQVLTSDGTNATWSTPAAGGSNTVILYMGSQLGFPTGTDVITNSSWTLLSSGGISGVSATSNTVTLPAGTYLFEFPIMNYTSNDGNYPAFIIKNNTASTTLGTIDNITSLTATYSGNQVPVIWAPKYYFTLSASSSISLYKSGSTPSAQKYFNDPRGGNLIYKITKA